MIRCSNNASTELRLSGEYTIIMQFRMQSQVETTEAKCSDILQSSSVSVVVTDLEYWSRHRRDSAFFGPGSGVKNV